MLINTGCDYSKQRLVHMLIVFGKYYVIFNLELVILYCRSISSGGNW